jgi:dTDP-glucose 4,6-dehydratase
MWKEHHRRIKFVWHDLRAPINEYVSAEIGRIDFVAHLAANSSVEATIRDPLSSVMDNVLGTVNLYQWARTKKIKLIDYFSTDETLGAAPEGINFKEDAMHNPTNPYSAGKASAEDYSHAFFITYGLPIFITRTMNVFAERQHPEKFIPTVMRKVLTGETLPVYSNKEKTKAGSRFWIYAQSVAEALLFLFQNANAGEKYHIVGEEKDNLDVAKQIAAVIGKPLNYEMVDFHSSRPGHDLRYGMSGEKLAQMGFVPTLDFDKSITQTVKWTLENRKWLQLGDE